MPALHPSLKRFSSLPTALALSWACGCQPLEPKAPDQPPAAAQATPPQAPSSPHADDERKARERADAWLSLVDQGQYAESWDAAAKLFQSSTGKDKWENALERGRTPLGKSSQRKLRAAEYKTQLDGAPAGEYVVVHYDSAFENKPTVREIVTLRKQADRSWKVAGYSIE
jgi:uncharacterized protein DUF4019